MATACFDSVLMTNVLRSGGLNGSRYALKGINKLFTKDGCYCEGEFVNGEIVGNSQILGIDGYRGHLPFLLC